MTCPKLRRRPKHLHQRHRTGYCLPGVGGAMREAVEKKVLSENDRLAAALRQRYPRRRYSMRQPDQFARLRQDRASWKKLWRRFPSTLPVAVLTGDLQTDNDARRLARYGFPVRQIVTGGTCHLDAHMVDRHLNEMGFPWSRNSLHRKRRQSRLPLELRSRRSGQNRLAQRHRRAKTSR